MLNSQRVDFTHPAGPSNPVGAGRVFAEDEADRKYSVAVLASLSEKRALVPLLWFYEVGNGLIMAHRASESPSIKMTVSSCT